MKYYNKQKQTAMPSKTADQERNDRARRMLRTQ